MRSPANEGRYREILESSAKVICQRGYEATSMQEIASACGLTKAGLYHYVQNKEALLLAIMHYGMDLFEGQVSTPASQAKEPLDRLRDVMTRNIQLVTDDVRKEVVIILHEDQTLTGEGRVQINARKKRFVRFLETAFEEAMERGQIRKVNPTIAAFSLLGMVLWTYKWYRPGGRLASKDMVDGMMDLFFQGLMPR